MISRPNGNPAAMTVLDGEPDATGVGVTPLVTAMSRARETTSPRPLFTDPYARLFVDAAREQAPEQSQEITDHTAAHTKWFDDFLLTASSAGVSQVVILDAGWDARAWRLPWLDDTVIFEVERPQVLEFKQRVLAQADVRPAARYVPVPVDAHRDWPRELSGAGFDHDEPTVWVAEALLPRLPADDQEHLLGQIDLYSARGSRIGIEVDPGGPDHECWLCARHWEVGSTATVQLLDRYHRARPGGGSSAGRSVLLDGRKL
ncbi:S-adenosyl-L-methionine-dependent methyltransferase [Mycobacterium sp. smrl_JER01]